jgi:predicted ABC-class ATPase
MDSNRLGRLCERLDGKNYGAYRQLEGSWRLGAVTLIVDRVQGDPFAAPSALRVRRPHGIDPAWLSDADAIFAAEDWLLRELGSQLVGRERGSGRSGALRVYSPGPEVVERSAVRIDGHDLELRLAAGLPARGRRVLGRACWEMLTELADASEIWPTDDLLAHIASVRTQRALRRALEPAGLIAFIADGSVLPRESGVGQRPLQGAVPFESPASQRVTLSTPAGPVTGLGIRAGVTVIVGGGFHGKSTVLHALQRGHLDHVPGDGRERVVSVPTAVKVRAEDGRRVAGVDISCLLRELPGGRSTAPFSSLDASGSTSQAAALVEAVEAGATVLLLDEDTCATNLMVRDARMRALIPRDREPITPLVERVRQVHTEWGVSTVLVIGGVGDYLAVADVVLSMEDYACRDRTADARALALPLPSALGSLPSVKPRELLSLGDVDRIKARSERRIALGDQELELAGVEQILDQAQAWTLGQALRVVAERTPCTMDDALAELDALIDAEGVEVLAPRGYPPGDLVRPRALEVAAAISRLRGLSVPGSPSGLSRDRSPSRGSRARRRRR